jgi:hypothetical protein
VSIIMRLATMKSWATVSRNTKQDNQMEWVARMNNIRSRATEIVNHDIIYN